MALRAFFHPLALLILLISVSGAIALQVRAPWSDRAVWIVVWGCLAYVATVLTGQFRQPAGIRGRRTRPVTNDASPSRGETALAFGTKPPLHTAPDTDDLSALVQESLRRLNNPAVLGACGIVSRMPHLLAAQFYESHAPEDEMMQLDYARTLRAVLLACIERIKDTGVANLGDGESGRFMILHDEYVLGRPNSQIMIRYSISESTFHRYRREAIAALARELARQEELAARARVGTSSANPG